ncbi:hypothetical protein CBR_g16166 [Chara braunii]|uniref:Casein kinase substrate phosphoprotein PP28 domain-containing protein n=1 Tax=Chara braunii TaxID=69332 RepID=A0A388KTR9_CHABU|nr:hypothetical protein CBR_g16166 [Chara braunii]|eukprot:GBG73451.1 hypothetical protein CBR_g16166 [Chara braunii]
MGKGGGRGKFKKGPTGRRRFSTPDVIGGSASSEGQERRRRLGEDDPKGYEEEEDSEETESDDEEEEDEGKKQKGVGGLIEVANPNRAAARSVKAKDADIEKPVEMSRREREELDKQKAKERYWKLHEQGKTEEARKDLERLAIIRQQREEAARKREEEKAAREAKKQETRKK